VTSVGLTVPTGLSVSGGPITASGTLTIAYSGGYQGYTTTEATKLAGIAAGAQVNVKPDWSAAAGTTAEILNKPAIPGGTVTSVGLTVPTGLSVSGGPITASGTLTIAYSGGYQGYTTTEATKLAGIAAGAQVNVKPDWSAAAGAPAEILNKPSLGSAAAASTSDFATAAQGAKADTAVQPGRGVATQHSLTGGGNLSADRTLNLVGDVASPGNNKFYGTDGSGVRGWRDAPSSVITWAAEQATTSGTAFDFTGIPSSASEIFIFLKGVSLSGTGRIFIQLGTASGVETTGYDGASVSGFFGYGGNAANIYTALSQLVKTPTNYWASQETFQTTAGGAGASSGAKQLAGVLTTVRLTVVGAGSFDAGSCVVGWR
jgi:hypothetical protein